MTQSEWQAVILSKFESPKAGKSGYLARCPAHDDQHPSLLIKFIPTHDGMKAAIKCQAGCAWEHVLAQAGLSKKDVFFHPNGDRPSSPTSPPQEKTFVEIDFDHPTVIYSYTDEEGHELYQNCRYETDKLGNRLAKKTFRQRHLVGNAWAYSLNGVRRVPYNLPALLREPDQIFDCEGEKDVETLKGIGLVATSTLPECRGELSKFCLGKHVVVCEDNDDPGRKKAQEKADLYWTLGTETVKILSFRDLPEHADVTDWVQQAPETHDLFAIQARLNEVEPYNPLQSITVDLLSAVTPRKPLLLINDRNVLPSGNLGGLVAGIGQGKSHLIQIMAACAIDPACEPFARFQVMLGENEQCVILDTEQPEDDCQEILYRAHRRTGQKLSHLTANRKYLKQLQVMSLINLSLPERREKLEMVIHRPEYKLIFIDGLLDFIGNPNDPTITSEFVIWLHSMAAKYDKGIFCVLHGNRNDITGKGKGWIGDLFQRKATCFLMLRKHKLDPTIRVLTSEFDNAKLRHAADTGLNIAIQWDEEFHGFRTVPYPEEEPDKLTPQEIFEQVFRTAQKLKMKKKELVQRYADISGKSVATAYREIEKALGIFLKKEALFYSLIEM